MECPKCKNDMGNEKVCSNCGYKRPVKKKCPKCGSIIKNGKFCENCGYKIKPKKKCPQCGNIVKSGMVCENCGYEFKKKSSIINEPQESNENTDLEGKNIIEDTEKETENIINPIMSNYNNYANMENDPINNHYDENITDDSISNNYDNHKNTVADPINNYDDYEKEKIKGSKGKGVSIIVVLLFLAIIVGIGIFAVFYLKSSTDPRKVFSSVGGEIYEKLSSFGQAPEDSTSESYTVNLSAKLSEDSEDVGNIKIKLDAGMDESKKIVTLGLDSSYNDNDLINGKIEYDFNDNIGYVKLENLFSKTLQIDLSSDGTYSDNTLNYNVKDYSKLKEILENEIKKNISDDYFSSEKSGLLTKNTLMMNGDQVIEVLNNIVNDLLKNSEFLECFENQTFVKDELNELKDNLAEVEIDELYSYSISIYTGGLTQKSVKKIEILLVDDYSVEQITLTPQDDNQWNYTVSENDNAEGEGTIKFEVSENNFNFETTVEADGEKLETTLQMTANYNSQIESVSKDNVVEYEELTSEDYEEIYDNLQESALYDIILNSIGSGVSDELEDEDEDDDNEEDDEDDEILSDLESTLETTEIDSETNATTSTDSVKKDDITVSYNVPDGFTTSSAEDSSYKIYYDEDKNCVKVSITNLSMEAYKNKIENKCQNYENNSNFKDVALSIDEHEIVEATTYTITYSYIVNNQTIECKEIYYASKYDENNIIAFETDSTNISEEDFDTFYEMLSF